ncbi:MAG TPA: aminotransferase, partial [Gammaproteobacteria bacterium]|nr:aminotransferase [Gammaproteobacteria bacterium]
LKMLASMRLCSNVPAQFAVQTGLHGYQSINDLVAPGGRLRNQRDIAWERINSIPGISCVKPQGALYLFPKLDPSVYPIVDDEKLMLKILKEEKILLVHGRAFNWPDPDHFRIVFLPNTDMLNSAMDGLERFFHRLRMNSK